MAEMHALFLQKELSLLLIKGSRLLIHSNLCGSQGNRTEWKTLSSKGYKPYGYIYTTSSQGLKGRAGEWSVVRVEGRGRQEGGCLGTSAALHRAELRPHERTCKRSRVHFPVPIVSGSGSGMPLLPGVTPRTGNCCW